MNEIHLWWWQDRERPDARFTVLSAYARRALCGADIERRALGKPYIADHSLTPIHFSISHRGGMSAMAVAPAPIGFDLERIALLADLETVARHVMACDEAQEFSRVTGADRLDFFYRCWTRKEAYLKAIGCGLHVEPRTVDSMHDAINAGDNCWHLHEPRILPGFATALATTITDAVIVPVGDHRQAAMACAAFA